MPVMIRVPATSGRTPNSGSANSGLHSVPKRKSVIGTAWKNSMVGTRSDQMMPMVVRIEIAAHIHSSAAMTRSPWRGRERRREKSLSGPLAVC